jgi:hypothetical protein
MKAKEFIFESIKLGAQIYAPNPKHPDYPKKITEAYPFKPKAKLWTSSAIKTKNGYTSEWVEWCKDNMPGWVGDKGYIFDVDPSARILEINSDRDALKIAKKYGVKVKDIFELFSNMPWDLIAKDYDAIHHTPNDNYSNILTSAWDVESTAWFDTSKLINKQVVNFEKESLNEVSSVNLNVHKKLLNKGYQYISSGVDQYAYYEPSTGMVLKIFGAGSNVKSSDEAEKYSASQRMFFAWERMSKRHENNIFFPKIHDYKPFQYGNQVYLQIRQERLNNVDADLCFLMPMFRKSAALGETYEEAKQAIIAKGPTAVNVLKDVIDYLSEKKLKLFYLTLTFLHKSAIEKGYKPDFHCGNIMQRKDKTPVFLDPWTIGQ